MLFHSYVFLFVFLPVVLAGTHLAPPRWRNGLLAGASFVFYGTWDWRFLPLLLLSTGVDYWVAQRIHRLREDGAERRRLLRWLQVSLATNLGLLGVFKYAGFFARSANGLFDEAWLPVLDVVLPVGISFYTFQSLSYTIDVYRGDARPVRSFVDFACYVSLFCQLVAGPIVRFRELQPQLEKREVRAADVVDGLHLFTIGLAKKVLLADAVAPIADAAFDGATPSFALAWCGALAYTMQIYFDFSGYSDMAIGLGRLFGFRLPQNFDSPYRAVSITDFWRRWHMSLSRWLRDYLYIPLGGNRRGPLRTYVNLMLTMLLGGLWHGANWTFVVWGAYHGALLALERRLGLAEVRGMWRLPRIGLTFVLALLGWVAFRSPDLATATAYVGALVTPAPLVLPGPEVLPASAYLFLGLTVSLAFLAPNSWRWRPAPRPATVVPMALLLALSIAVALSESYSPFLYFQF